MIDKNTEWEKEIKILRCKTIKKVVELSEKNLLPMSYGRFSSYFRYLNAGNCKRLLGGLVKEDQTHIVDIDKQKIEEYLANTSN